MPRSTRTPTIRIPQDEAHSLDAGGNAHPPQTTGESALSHEAESILTRIEELRVSKKPFDKELQEDILKAREYNGKPSDDVYLELVDHMLNDRSNHRFTTYITNMTAFNPTSKPKLIKKSISAGARTPTSTGGKTPRSAGVKKPSTKKGKKHSSSKRVKLLISKGASSEEKKSTSAKGKKTTEPKKRTKSTGIPLGELGMNDNWIPVFEEFDANSPFRAENLIKSLLNDLKKCENVNQRTLNHVVAGSTLLYAEMNKTSFPFFGKDWGTSDTGTANERICAEVFLRNLEAGTSLLTQLGLLEYGEAVQCGGWRGNEGGANTTREADLQISLLKGFGKEKKERNKVPVEMKLYLEDYRGPDGNKRRVPDLGVSFFEMNPDLLWNETEKSIVRQILLYIIIFEVFVIILSNIVNIYFIRLDFEKILKSIVGEKNDKELDRELKQLAKELAHESKKEGQCNKSKQMDPNYYPGGPTKIPFRYTLFHVDGGVPVLTATAALLLQLSKTKEDDIKMTKAQRLKIISVLERFDLDASYDTLKKAYDRVSTLYGLRNKGVDNNAQGGSSNGQGNANNVPHTTHPNFSPMSSFSDDSNGSPLFSSPDRDSFASSMSSYSAADSSADSPAYCKTSLAPLDRKWLDIDSFIKPDADSGVKFNKHFLGTNLAPGHNSQFSTALSEVFKLTKSELAVCFPQLCARTSNSPHEHFVMKLYACDLLRDKGYVKELFQSVSREELWDEVYDEFSNDLSIPILLKDRVGFTAMPELICGGLIHIELQNPITGETRTVNGLYVLSEFLEERKDADFIPSETRRSMVEKALKPLHDAGIFHGDVARRNVIFKEDKAYLIDFSRSFIRDPKKGSQKEVYDDEDPCY